MSIDAHFFKNKVKVLLVHQYEIIKGIVQPFELGGVTRLIRSAVKFGMAGI